MRVRSAARQHRRTGTFVVHVLLDVVRMYQLGLRSPDFAQDTQLETPFQILSLVSASSLGFPQDLLTYRFIPSFQRSLSLLGAALCVAVMFMSDWFYALIAIGLASVLYKYIEYRG